MKENQKRKLKKAWLITINITSWLTTISGALMILTTLINFFLPNPDLLYITGYLIGSIITFNIGLFCITRSEKELEHC
jgi:hypothetical protein